jgi:hypothetical protein
VILGLAQRKRGAAAVTWRHGLADELPLPDASADAAVMSLSCTISTPKASAGRSPRPCAFCAPVGGSTPPTGDGHTTH